MKCLFFVSSRWHLPDLGKQREGEEPAGFHLGQSLLPHCLVGTLRKLWFSKQLVSKAEHPKKDQPASYWGHWAAYSLGHLLMVSRPSLFLAGGCLLPAPGVLCDT